MLSIPRSRERQQLRRRISDADGQDRAGRRGRHGRHDDGETGRHAFNSRPASMKCSPMAQSDSGGTMKLNVRPSYVMSWIIARPGCSGSRTRAFLSETGSTSLWGTILNSVVFFVIVGLLLELTA